MSRAAARVDHGIECQNDMQSEPLPKIAKRRTSSDKSNDPILIREIASTDAEAAAQLSAELGYPAELEEMKERIGVLNSSRNRVVYVACAVNAVIGWIDVGIVHHLSTGAHGEIGGFVVSAEYRSSGIGRKLITQAEQWVADQGIPTMTVRSRTTREAAHRFYIREGYTMTKTSAVFFKQLNSKAH
jgi:GNAT superfamily N-acetyltransferase